MPLFWRLVGHDHDAVLVVLVPTSMHPLFEGRGSESPFELAGSSFQFPDYENVETFVNRLVRENVLVSDPVVKVILDCLCSASAIQ